MSLNNNTQTNTTFMPINNITQAKNNNILLNNNNQANNNYLVYLKYLIKMHYFQEDLYEKIKSPHKIITDLNKTPNNIFLINKDIMDNIKNYFEFGRLSNCLRKYSQMRKINYENIDNMFTDIITNINKDDKDYLNLIQNKAMPILINSNDDNKVKIKTIEINQTTKKKLNYFNDFEIINNEICTFLKSQLIKNLNYIQGNYIAGDGKLLIILNVNNNNYYEFGHINNNIFIIEYLIEEVSRGYRNFIFDYFNKFGFKSIIENKFTEGIPTLFKNEKNQPILNCYEIKNNEESNDRESSDTYDILFIKNIFEILKDIYLFEIDLKTKITYSLNPNNYNIQNLNFYIYDCYLVNENYLSNFKTLFSYDNLEHFKEQILLNNYNIEKIIYDNKDYFFKSILNKKKTINQNVKKIDLLKINKKTLIVNNNKYFSYPNNFGILPKCAYEKLLELLKININLVNRLKSDLGFNAGKILLKPKLESFFEDNKEKNYLSYIYSLKNDKNKLDYNPEYILYFNSNNERFNHL